MKLLPAQIRNVGFKKICLDSPTRKSDHHKPVGLYPCHRQGGNQVFCQIQFDRLRQYQFAGVFVQNFECLFRFRSIFQFNALFYARWTARFYFLLHPYSLFLHLFLWPITDSIKTAQTTTCLAAVVLV